MATEDHNHDPLRNPLVDYERADLSARGIVGFLVGLLICCFFIELVIWGMFRFLGKSESLFDQGHVNPMASVQKAPAPANPRSVLQNAPAVNTSVFPQPRLQVNDARDAREFLQSEEKVLYTEQPFKDQTGAIHIPITEAMKLIEERGLPVRPSSPPPDFNAETVAGNATVSNTHAPEASENGSKGQKLEGQRP
jgi:hypothetical protein